MERQQSLTSSQWHRGTKSTPLSMMRGGLRSQIIRCGSSLTTADRMKVPAGRFRGCAHYPYNRLWCPLMRTLTSKSSEKTPVELHRSRHLDADVTRAMNNETSVGTVDHLVEFIVTLNPTANRTWLSTFDPWDLHRYAQHLECASQPRHMATAWQRTGDTPAIVARSAA